MTEAFRCLAIETATQNCSVAVCDGSLRSLRETSQPGVQSRGLFRFIAEALNEADLSLGDLDCIALGVGPGGFTGLRVGAAAAQSLAFGADLPVCRISTLATLAAGVARDHQVEFVAPCLDARMGEAYLGLYRVASDGLLTATRPDSLVDPETFEIEADTLFFAAGPGWTAFPELARRHSNSLSGKDYTRLPSAADMFALARFALRGGESVTAAQAQPNYVRDKVTSGP